MQWWCAARDVAWSWQWQPYPGVWLFMLTLVSGALLVARRAADRGAWPAWRRWLFAAGVILLWAALDWPIGALGAGYLASAHMLQFLLIAMAAPPLLLLGLPPAAFVLLDETRLRALRRLTHPLLALGVFNAVVIATHLPQVTDTWMRTQLGSFAIDALWLGAGLLYWWPVVAQVPERPRFTAPVKMGYIFASMVLMTAPGAMITFSQFPIYALYELAPPTGFLSTIDDQRLAGLMMKVGGGGIAWAAIGILFYRWTRAEEELLVREREALHSSR